MNRFMEAVKRIVEESEYKMSYVPYRDGEGNMLKSDEIIFTNKAGYEALQKKEKNQIYTVHTPGVVLRYDDAGNFPIALSTESGELLYLKISKKTGEILPIHAGCCPVLSVIYTGAPSAGKTVSTLQMTDPAFHDMVARKTYCSIEDDLPSAAPKRMNYEEARRKFKREHIMPEPTKRNEILQPYVYYVQYGEKGKEKRVLLKIEDIDGQQCTEMTWDSKIFQSNYLVLTIGADEIVSGENGLDVQYSRVVDQLIPRLRVLRQDKDYEILVMLTKSDCLDRENPYLKNAFVNSIECIDGKMKQLAHEEGFDYSIFNKRSKCIENYVSDVCPNLYNKLINALPKENITFSMIASVGEKCIDNHFETYNPFCIDEPILSLLAKAGMYPIKVGDVRPKEEKVESITVFSKRTFVEKVLDMLRERIRLNVQEGKKEEEDNAV